MEIRLTERQEQILRLAGAGLLLTAGIIMPNVVGATFKLAKQINDLINLTAGNRYYYKKQVERLVDKDIFHLAGDRVYLTKRGKKILNLIKLSDIKIERPDIWNGIWHLVSYDIPEKYKEERNIFRERLFNIGFKRVQKSLWVVPYECREEIAIIAKTLGISLYVAYVTTNHLPRQESLISRFNLKQTSK